MSLKHLEVNEAKALEDIISLAKSEPTASALQVCEIFAATFDHDLIMVTVMTPKVRTSLGELCTSERQRPQRKF